ncbi:MAG: metal-dependent hydrolase [Flavobacteriales bacterium]|jgi:inner membrane protein
MDSLSQVVLGAAVGELVWGRKMGNRAQLLGAIGGTLPDLDILFNYWWTDPIEQLHIHRGYSHSVFVHLLVAIPYGWITWKWMKDRISFRESWLVWFLFFFTHALLDCCTTYGTQLLLPFSDYLVGFNNIAVVDPFWTLPFMLSLLVCLFLRRNRPGRIRWAYAGVAYASAYMALTLVNKAVVHSHFAEELGKRGIVYTRLSTSPTMFNNILWNGIALTPDSIYLGEYSLLQDDPAVQFVSYSRGEHLLAPYMGTSQVETLTWFSQGFHFTRAEGDTLQFFLAKWGRMDFTEAEAEKAFVFHWELVKNGGAIQEAIQVQPGLTREEFNRAIREFVRRIRGEESSDG